MTRCVIDGVVPVVLAGPETCPSCPLKIQAASSLRAARVGDGGKAGRRRDDGGKECWGSVMERRRSVDVSDQRRRRESTLPIGIFSHGCWQDHHGPKMLAALAGRQGQNVLVVGCGKARKHDDAAQEGAGPQVDRVVVDNWHTCQNLPCSAGGAPCCGWSLPTQCPCRRSWDSS